MIDGNLSMESMISPKRLKRNRLCGRFFYHNSDMNSFRDRVRKKRIELGLSQAELAKASGMSQTTISDIERGRNDGSREIVALAGALRVSSEWLSTGKGPSSNVAQATTDTVYGIRLGGPRALPIISYVQAGAWREIVDTFPPGGADEYIKPRNEHGPHSFALYVEGDSMTPEFNAGDIIIVDPDIAPNPGNYVIARNHSHEATFKKYRPRGRDADGREVFELVPLNDDYATLRSDQDGAVIIGTVVEHIRILR